MAWYDIGIWVMVAIVAAPFLYILFGLLRSLVEMIQDRKIPKKPVPPDRDIETAYGVFKRGSGTWYGKVPYQGRMLDVSVNDVDDAPDAEFMAKLPERLRLLDGYETAAREYFQDRVENLSEEGEIPVQYEFYGISSPSWEEYDFTLEFSFDMDSWGESVYVDFKNGEPANYSSVD